MDPGTIAGITIGAVTGIVLLSLKGRELHKRRERVRTMAKTLHPESMLPRYSNTAKGKIKNIVSKKSRKQNKKK
jgi:hypothetical protein